VIVDRNKDPWVHVVRRANEWDFLIGPKKVVNMSDEEYLRHWGKWLIFGSPERMWDLARKLDPFVEAEEVDSAKFTRAPREGHPDCVMCVYCDDRDRERVWKILEGLGVERRIWKYDRETLGISLGR